MTGQRRVIARVLSDTRSIILMSRKYIAGRRRWIRACRSPRCIGPCDCSRRRESWSGGISAVGRARYEPTEHGKHHHLIDVESGKVTEFEDGAHEALIEADRGPAGVRARLLPAGAVRA